MYCSKYTQYVQTDLQDCFRSVMLYTIRTAIRKLIFVDDSPITKDN